MIIHQTGNDGMHLGILNIEIEDEKAVSILYKKQPMNVVKEEN